MAPEPDPYRTLGLEPNATMGEVKAAYRRLAKVNHPDAAGAGALPRFLAIQAAYERIAGPATGRPRTRATTPRPAAPSWEADPARSDATHRAYGGRRRGSARPTGAAGRSGSAGPPGGGAGHERPSSSGPADASRPAGPRKKATLGSTSYDGVDRESFEPGWGGASWYGTTSGTYWTINPKEYADPRKHGPEYQARARRRADADGGADAEGPPDAGASVDGPPAAEAPPAGAQAGEPEPRHTTSSWWAATAGPGTAEAGPAGPAADEPTPRRRQAQTAAPRPSTPLPPASTENPATGLPSLAGTLRSLTTGRSPSPPWRLARAVIGWLPIALGIGWASGELTGCGRFAATCDDGVAPFVWFLQLLTFGLLLALPTIAGWAVVGAVACLVVAVPVTLFITATAGGTAATSGTALLGVVLAIAWSIAVVVAVVRDTRRSQPARPVS